MKEKRRFILALLILLSLLITLLLLFPRPLVNTQWTLESMNGDTAQHRATIQFTIPLSINGSAGCNFYDVQGYLRIANRITTGPVLVTAMECETSNEENERSSIMNQETTFLNILEDVNQYSIEEERLVLRTSKGDTLIFTSDEIKARLMKEAEALIDWSFGN